MGVVVAAEVLAACDNSVAGGGVGSVCVAVAEEEVWRLAIATLAAMEGWLGEGGGGSRQKLAAVG